MLCGERDKIKRACLCGELEISMHCEKCNFTSGDNWRFQCTARRVTSH